MKWPMAVQNLIPSLNGRVIIQSQVAAWSKPIICGRLYFGAHLCLYVSVSELSVSLTAQVLHLNGSKSRDVKL